MHAVVSDQPYEFVAPYHGRCWPWLLQRLVPWWLRRHFGIEKRTYHGVELLKESLAAGHSVLIAPNHCRPSDPLVINDLCRRAGTVPFTMASWHLFLESPLQRFVLRRIGGFSIYREGLDRQALGTAIEILADAKRPLVIFPEGVITRTNDRLCSLMDGVSFIARSAAKKRAEQSPPGKVVIHPIAIRYHFEGDIDNALHETLDAIEQRLSWRPRRDPDRVARIYRVGEALLWLKEIEYFGQPQQGDIPTRLDRLIDQILVPLEQEWRNGRRESHTVARVKQLRTAILRDMITGEITDEDRNRRWNQLADMYLAQQLSHYAPEYVRSNPTTERLLETVERFEEDLTDASRIHRPMSVTVTVGPAIEVAPKRARGTGEDPVMRELDHQLREMLGIAPLATPKPLSGVS
jgi:1-acyl-sn-glycerol-3-phosphate acyltransferase